MRIQLSLKLHHPEFPKPAYMTAFSIRPGRANTLRGGDKDSFHRHHCRMKMITMTMMDSAQLIDLSASAWMRRLAPIYPPASGGLCALLSDATPIPGCLSGAI